jgi:hypothetical protein
MHVTGEGLFSQAKGRPERTPLPCMESYMDKILQLRKDYRLHDNTQMMVLLSLCTKDMNKYVSMYPEVWFVDCTAGTNRQKRQLFVMAVRTSTGSTLPGNLTIIPSEQKWVFHSIYSLAFRYLYSDDVCSRNRVVLTDEDDAEYTSFEGLIETSSVFSKSTVMLCTFHAIWMAFKKDLLPRLDACEHGKVVGKIRLYHFVCIILLFIIHTYQFVHWRHN